MDQDDDYELLPRQDVEKLKKEIERLKKNPLGEAAENETLMGSINELNSNIKKLIDIFANTESEIAKYYAENNPLDDLKALKDQNEQIAQGLLAVADMVREIKNPGQAYQPMTKMPEQATNAQANQNYSQQTMQYGGPSQPQGYYPIGQPSDFTSPPSPQGMQPPPFIDPQIPPTPEKKKGLFSRR